jgi:phage protein D
VRYPRLRVLAGGILVPGAFDAEVMSNNHYAADRFRIGLALSADPARGAVWWAEQDDVLVDIEVSLGDGFINLLRGIVDRIEIDALSDVVRLQGRDLSAGLIEARTQEAFANHTSSEIAVLLAGRHGLSPDVQTTTTPVGRYRQLEHDRLVLGGFARATTEWDLLATLAQYEGFDVWVHGTALHFRPPDPPVVPMVLRADDFSSLHLERTLTLAGDIEVTVKSWHSRTAHSYVQTARAGQRSSGGGKAQRYVYIVPNLMPDEALKLAQRRLAELTRHERVIVAEMPGELTLAPRQQILLQGTGTSFDRVYWVDSVERRLDMSHGFTQCLQARNAEPAARATGPADKVGQTWTGF